MNGFCSICGEYAGDTRHDCPASAPVLCRPVGPGGIGQLPVYARPIFPPEVKRRAKAASRETSAAKRKN